jgi:U3 small nucleolar RNA-associated protein 21
MLFDVSLLAVAENKEVRIDEPGEADDSDLEDAAEVDFKFSSSTEPLETGALTLSSMPETQWKNILHLDVIKERNKPIAAKSTRRKAPFFLPSATDMNAVQKSRFVAEPEPKSQIISLTEKPNGGDLCHIFVDLLRSQQWDKALEHLMKQTASGTHLCWSEIGLLAGGDDEDLTFALHFFKHHMDKNHHADLVQTYLSLFLSFHGDVLREGVGDQEVDELLKKQRETWNKADLQCQKILCFLKMLTQTLAQW